MSVITVLVPGELAPNLDEEREYDVAFERLRGSWGRTKFYVFQVWDENGHNVMGAERELVVKHATECYYAEMLAAVSGQKP